MLGTDSNTHMHLFCILLCRIVTTVNYNEQLLRAMPKLALMTFSNIEAHNFYFNAKLIAFAMFLYRFNVCLTYCSIYRDYETHGYLLLHILLLLW